MPNAYNITMIVGLFCLAVGLGVVFAYTRSLLPSMIAHAIINIPMTPKWQLATLTIFIIGLVITLRTGTRAIKDVFRHAAPGPCVLLALVGTAYVIAAQRFAFLSTVAVVLLILAVLLEWIVRERRTFAAT